MTRIVAAIFWPLRLRYLRAVLAHIERRAPRSYERVRVEREIADAQARQRRLNNDWTKGLA